jgi:hypothetical protein
MGRRKGRIGRVLMLGLWLGGKVYDFHSTNNPKFANLLALAGSIIKAEKAK